MNEQQQEYGGIIINGIDCSGGGGTSVTPNPPAPATETLSSLDINGVVYGIEQETRENIFSIFDTSNKNSRCSDGELTPGESFWFEINDPDPNTDWSGSMTIYNNNAYDLTGIDKLELVVDITQQSDYGYLWLTFSDTKYTWGTSSWPGVYQNKTSALQISQSGNYEVDVSSLTGNYYIYIGATSGKDSVAPGDCNNAHNGYIKGTVTAFNIISTSSGTKVIPNPSGSAIDTLEKLQIENTIYDFDAGTEVIANPTGTATADLNKISIGGIIYNIVNGGSGGGGNFESTTLYTGTQRDNTINLSDDYTNYDYLVLQGYATASPGFLNSNLISVNDITIGNNIGISDNSAFIWYTITNTDEFTFSGADGTYYIKAIYGLKESEGGGYLTLVPCYAEFIEGFNNTYWNTHLGQLNAEYFLDFYIDQYQNDRSILGSSGGPGRLHLTMYSNKWYTSTGNGETSFGDSTMITGRHTFRWNTISDSKILFDEQDTGLTCSQSEVKDINIYINNRSARSTNDTCTNSRMYEFKITAKDGTVLHDFKPYALYAGSTLIWKGVMDVVGGMEADGWFNVKEIPGGGSTLVGADVEANPSETPTDTLSSIRIGDTVYNIEGGGGGGTTSTLLYKATDTTKKTFQLSDDWTNYDSLLVNILPPDPTNTGPIPGTSVINTASITEGLIVGYGLSGYTWYKLNPQTIDTRTFSFWISDGCSYYIDSVVGVKQGGGGTGGGNVDDVYVNGQSVLDSNKIAQVKTHVEKTTADYYNIPAEIRNTDNILYAITDDGIHLGDTFNPVIYSTEEREIGVWTDNKPLYQKTFNGAWQLNGTSWSGTLVNIPNAELKNTQCLNSDWQSMGVNGNIDSNGNLTLYNLRSVTLTARAITIQYTKTTDVAGSGSYNALGVPTVHYTTDEQVIGTWIDGKPLYERSYSFTNTRSSFTDYVTLYNIPNIETVVKNTFTALRDLGQNEKLHYTGEGTSRPEHDASYYINVREYNGNIQYRINGYGTQITEMVITTQYTKTTD